MSHFLSLVELIRWRAAMQPHRQALGFMVNGQEQEITYAELDNRARSIAAVLQELKLDGERALLMYPPGLEYITTFFGCLYAGIVAVPVYPPRLNRSLSRIESIVTNAQAKLALTSDRIYQSIQNQLTGSSELRKLKWLTSHDLLEAGDGASWKEKNFGADNLVFLQYTSGSTSQPKGVRLTNGNLLHNAGRITHSFGLTEETKLVLWLPPYHDMGLIGGIISPLYAGLPSTLMAPVDFLQSPFQWLKLISDMKANVSGGPNFAYDLCVEAVTEEQMEGLDLTSWRLAFNGAEPIRAETLDRFRDKFSACGFKHDAYFPCYGLAESTLMVTSGELGKGPSVSAFSRTALGEHQVRTPKDQEDHMILIGSGRSMEGQDIRIVRPDKSEVCDADEIGEIWVSSPSVAEGYWNNQEATEQCFGRMLPDDPRLYLATGDLGCIRNGELYITGRKKDLLIIHGINYYPQDIEASAEQAHPALRIGHGAVFSVEVNRQEMLVIVHEVERKYRKSLNPEEVSDAIRSRIAEEFGLHTYAVILLNPGRIPKTSSGKIQRHLCKKEFLSGTLDMLSTNYISSEPPTTESPDQQELLQLPVEERAVRIGSYVRGLLANALNIDESRLSRDESIVNWGLDSLAALELINRVNTDLGVSLSVVNLLNGTSVPDLTQDICRKMEEGTAEPASIINEEKNWNRQLSYGQKALWFLQQYEPENTAYNLSFAFKSTSRFQEAVLQQSFQYLIERHEVLRTVYPMENKQPVASTLTNAILNFEIIETADHDEQKLRSLLSSEAHKPFKLEEEVFRIRLIRTSQAGDILLLSVHHIAADLWSLVQLMEEWGQVYPEWVRGEQVRLPESAGRYRSFVMQQQQLLDSPRGQELAAYWEEQFSKPIEQLRLPLDKPRPKNMSYKGSCYDFEIGQKVTKAIKDLSRAQGVTLYALLMASFQVLLHHYSGQTEICVGTPTAERHDPRMKDTVGYYVNPVVIRGSVEDNPSFVQFLKTIQQQVLGAIQHQGYPFARLLEHLQVTRDPGVSPLFQVMFVLEKPQKLEQLSSIILGRSGEKFALGDLQLESFGLQPQTAQFDLTLMIVETEGKLGARLEYNTDLFTADTAKQMAESFKILLGGIAADPDCQVSRLPVIPVDERRKVLTEWNATQCEYELDKPLIQWIEEQAERTPDAMALRFEGRELTYSELDRQAEQLAGRLRIMGAGPEQFVGISVERSLAMMVGLLGILKSGAAYVPLDPSYPRERLAFMLQDAGVPILLTQSHLAAGLPEHAAQIVLLDGPEASPPEELAEEEPVKSAPGPKDAVYMIYTSGSTGTPKGVINIQEAVVNRLLWMQDTFRLTPEDRVMQKTPISFDVSVWELFWPLMTGAGLIIAAPEGHKDPDYLLRLIREEQVTTLHFVPSMLQMFVEQPGVENTASLKRVICSGEALPYELQERYFTRVGAELWNLYGPTEAAIDVTFWKCSPGTGTSNVPIGYPVANTQMYVLNRELQPVPAGVTGDLYIGGVQLARGYHGRAELTNERFLPDPFRRDAGARIYKTGDLARYGPDGRLEYAGRSDDQIKLRGFRIELGEIEAAMLKHPEVLESAVVVREDGRAGKRLIGYWTSKKPGSVSAAELRSYLKEELPEYMVPAAWLEVEAMPLTPSGKTDRRQLPMPQESRPELETGYVPPSNETERKLAGIWQDVLGVDRVGVNDNFFTLGGHSLMATQLASWIRESLGTEILLKAIFEHPTISELSRYLEQHSQPSAYGESSEKLEGFNEGNADDRDADDPLSFAQQRLWFLNHYMEDKAAYNIPGALRFKGNLNLQALRSSLNEIISRHEGLRSAFHELSGIPFVQIRELVDLELDPLPCPYADEDRESAIQRLAAEEASKPFDLSSDPLIRASLFRLDTEDHLFLVTMHHIVSDGWSLAIFTQELSKLYNAYLQHKTSPLTPLQYQYSHYARWQRRYLAEPQWTSQLNYWKKKLRSLKPVLMLPADFPRPEQQRFRGSVHRFRLDAGLLESLQELGRSEGATLFMTLLAAFNILLSRYTNEDDIAVGVPVAGRNRKEIEPIIGFFANTLVLRTDLSGVPDFRQMLRQVRESCLEAYDNQDVPFEKLVEILQPVRNLMYSPLFQVMFILQNNELPVVGLDHILTEPVQYDQGIAKFDLTLTFEETASGLEGNFEYNTDLFHPDTIYRMAGYFQDLLQAVTEHPDWNIHTLSIPQKENPQTSVEPQYEKVQPSAEGFTQLFEEQVHRTPDSAAIVYEGQTVSYSELNGRAELLAVRLLKEGIGEGCPVGLFMERSPDFAASLLGILKSGAFCVPIDAECSTERMNAIAEDSGMQLILTQQHLKEKLPSFPGQIIAIDDAGITRTDYSMKDRLEFKSRLRPDQMACLLYTSGSGSALRGVNITHSSLTVQAKRMEDLLKKELTEKPLRAGWTGSTESESLLMQMQYLLYGHTLYPVRHDIRVESAEMLTFAREHEIEIFACTPPQLRMLIGEGLTLQRPTALKTICVIGELLDQALWSRLAKSEDIGFYQIFGMPEQAGAAFGCRIADHVEPCLGQPLYDVKPAVLNRYKQPVPLGAAGELYFTKPGPGPLYWRSATVHHAETSSLQAEWFSSGVWVRRLPDGSIRYIGTIDDDAESEGFRMEKEPVEAVLYLHPAVRQVCLKKIDSDPVPVLAVYLSVHQESVTASELKEYMHMRLPGHLIPRYLVLLDNIPLTHCGQYDMTSLPHPDTTSNAAECSTEPRNAIDEFILKYWRELLGAPDMGIHDHFFERGGHSLLAMEVISQVRDEFGVQLSIKTLFDSPTVARLSNEIERLLIEEIESMDEEEARLLLEAE